MVGPLSGSVKPLVVPGKPLLLDKGNPETFGVCGLYHHPNTTLGTFANRMSWMPRSSKGVKTRLNLYMQHLVDYNTPYFNEDTPWGRGVQVRTNGSKYFKDPGSATLRKPSELYTGDGSDLAFTVMWLGRIRKCDADTKKYFWLGEYSGGDYAWGFYANGISGLTCYIKINAGAAAKSLNFTDQDGTNFTGPLMMGYSGAGIMRAWNSGSKFQEDTTTIGAGGVLTSTAFNMYLGPFWQAKSPTVNTAMIVIWDRLLDANEGLRITANPHRLFVQPSLAPSHFMVPGAAPAPSGQAIPAQVI